MNTAAIAMIARLMECMDDYPGMTEFIPADVLIRSSWYLHQAVTVLKEVKG